MRATTPDPIEEIGLTDAEFRAMHGRRSTQTMDDIVTTVSHEAVAQAATLRLLHAGRLLMEGGG